MHVAQPTPTGLVLRFYPLKIWLLCTLLATTGLATMVGLGRVTILTCDRITLRVGSCTVESLGLEGDRRQSIPLHNVDRAALSSTASVVLRTTAGTIPVTAPLGSNPNLSRALVVTQINQFLENPVAVRLVFQDDGRAFAYPFGLIFILGSGVMLMMFGSIVSWDLDRQGSSFKLKHQSFLTTLVCHYPLHAIDRLQLEPSRSNADIGGCGLYLLLYSGQRIPLAHRYFLSQEDALWVMEQLTPFFQQE